MRNIGQKWIENPFESEWMPGTNFILFKTDDIFFYYFNYSAPAVQNFNKQY